MDISHIEAGRKLEPLVLKILKKGGTPVCLVRDIDDPSDSGDGDDDLYLHQMSMPVKQSDFFSCLVKILTQDANGPKQSVKGKRSAVEQILKGNFQLDKPVLVVEDNRVNREVAKLLLNKLGLTSKGVASGAQAIEELSKNDYSVVFMDCQMPLMDGFETTRRIRKAEKGKKQSVKIIAFTAEAMEGDRQKCLKAGMNDYISKPVTLEKMSQVLQLWLPKHGAGNQPGEPVDESKDFSEAARSDSESESSPGDSVFTEVEVGPVDHLSAQPAEASSDHPIHLLQETFGGEAAQRLFNVFQTLTPKLLNKIKVALKQKDAKVLKAATHELKGQCAMVRAQTMVEVGQRLEKALQMKNWRDVEDIYSELQRAFDLLVSESQELTK
jgi:polar amino acid transport system substrate-binding protein